MKERGAVSELSLEGGDDLMAVVGEELATGRLAVLLGAKMVLDVGDVARHRRRDEIDRLASQRVVTVSLQRLIRSFFQALAQRLASNNLVLKKAGHLRLQQIAASCRLFLVLY